MLKEKLLSGEKKVAAWGIGFIGFTTVANFAFNGVRCIGYDIDAGKVRSVNRGKIPIENLEYWLGFDIKKLTDSGVLKATTDYNDLLREDVAVHFVCIPTEHNGTPYDNILKDVIGKIAGIRRPKGSEAPLVIVESTLTPGRSDEIVLPMLREAGLEVGKDILYGVAPRRDWFVSPEKSLKRLPRVFGGTNRKTNDLMKEALSIVCDVLVPAPDHTHAEMVKSIENAYRHLEITLANQLTLAYPSVDMTEILRLVGTKWNIGTYHPSFGTGGYCIPLSSKYVMLGAERPEELTLLKQTVESDSRMPEVVAETMAKKGFRKVGILGLAYKGDIKVSILSPTIAIAKRLSQLGVAVKVNDPYFTKEEIKSQTGADSFDFPDGLDEFEALLVVADHQPYRFTPHADILKHMKSCKLVLDNTEIWKDVDFSPTGTEYHIAGDTDWLKV